MKINVKHNPFMETGALWGNFIFIKDENGVIRNLETIW